MIYVNIIKLKPSIDMYSIEIYIYNDRFTIDEKYKYYDKVNVSYEIRDNVLNILREYIDTLPPIIRDNITILWD